MRSDALNNALIETSKSILGKRINRKQPSWVTAETIRLIDAQTEAKARYKKMPTSKGKQRWRDLQKQVSASFERDQAAHLEAQITDLELAAHRREFGTVWKIVGYISAQPKKPVKVPKLDGSMRRATHC